MNWRRVVGILRGEGFPVYVAQSTRWVRWKCPHCDWVEVGQAAEPRILQGWIDAHRFRAHGEER